MEDYFIKCSLCLKILNKKRKIVTLNCGHNYCSDCISGLQYSQICVYCNKKISDFSLNNKYLIELYNSNYSFNTNNRIEEKVCSYCIDCEEIINTEKVHKLLYFDHKLLSLKEMKEKIERIKQNFNAKLKRNKLVYLYIQGLKEKLQKNDIKSSISKNLKEVYLYNMIDNLQEIKKQTNFTKIKETIQIPKEKIIFTKKKNITLTHELNKSLFLSYKYIHRTIKNEEKKTLVTYIKNTKKIVVYNIEDNTCQIIEINNLPFNFFKLSHSIDYHPRSTSVIISGGKQDTLIYSEASKVTWQYNTKSKSLNRLFETPNGLANHKGVIIDNFYFIIGGNDYGDRFFDNVYKINLLFHGYNEIKEICRLNIPRSCFGVSIVNDDLIYVFFGLSNELKLINSIEVISTNKICKFAKLIELNNDNLRLKDVGVVYDKTEQKLIILGGQNENNYQNQKYFIYEKEKNHLIERENNKFIADSHFSSIGIQYDNICAVLSNDRMTGVDPYVFKYDIKQDVWTYFEINI